MNADEYNAALAEIDTLMDDAEPGTPDGDRLEELVDAVEAYDEVHYPIERPKWWAYWWYSWQMHTKRYLLKRALAAIRTALTSLWGDSGGEVEWP